MSLERILETYFTAPKDLIPFLQELDKDVLVQCFAYIIHRYATDVNPSGLREWFTLLEAGYKPTPGKLGYNGEANDGRPCDVKPVNIRSDSGKKLNGLGNFSDFRYERLERYLKDNVMMLVSGFVDGQLVYILEFPFRCIEGEIHRQLDKFFVLPREPGQYLRSASFSYTHYRDCPELKTVYKAPNLHEFSKFLTRNLYFYLRG